LKTDTAEVTGLMGQLSLVMLFIIIIWAKYGTVEATCIFLPIAVETLGVLNKSASQFFQALGQRISQAM